MITIFIADDHFLVREGLIRLLTEEGDLAIAGQAGDGETALREIGRLQPDVAILDISMPKLNGIEVARKLQAAGFAGKIIMLTQYDKEEYVREAIQTGASGYLLKDSIKADVVAAIRKVAADGTFFSPAVSQLLVDGYFRKLKGKSDAAPELTSRETEVLRLIAEGHSTKQIAEKLFLSPRTVDFHRANICQKLDLHDIAGLTKYAIRQGLIKI